MTSPTHDALGLAIAFVVFAPAVSNPTGLIVAGGCIALQGLGEGLASARQRQALKRDPQARWRGPRRKVTRPLRVAAIVGAGVVSLPLGVALATSRLPDQAEVGGIDHRKLTHYLVTAVALVGACWYASTHWKPELAVALTGGLAVGLLQHLAADGCTLSGVPFFGPFLRRCLHLLPRPMRVRTGSCVDTAIGLAAVGLTVYLAVRVAPTGWQTETLEAGR
jgi:membrane-bound metal-dependent hydrolase YbcI (DUF457 family)